MDSKSSGINNSDTRERAYAKDEAQSSINEFGGGSGNFSFKFDTQINSDEVYRSARSQAYMDIVSSIDLLSATDEEIIEKLKSVVDEDTLEEFADMSTEDLLEELRLCFEEEMACREAKLKDLPEPEILLAVVSECFITGCDIHAIDKKGTILQHYSKAKKMPDELAQGRIVYNKFKGKCSCVEIYNNCCRVIGKDGTVTRIDKE